MSIATKCTEDLMEKIKGLDRFGSKVFQVYSENDLFDQSKSLRLPAVGVSYGGIESSEAKDGSRQGLHGTLRMIVILLIDSKHVGLNREDEATFLLDEIRCSILTTKSPTGHKWQFTSEMAMGDVNNALLYLQRWQTSCPLTI